MRRKVDTRLLSVAALLLLMATGIGCHGRAPQSAPGHPEEQTLPPTELHTIEFSPESETLLRFREYGLVNIHEYAPDILVELKYATPDNFFGQVAYTDFSEAWLADDVALRLARVQEHLAELHPGYRLLIYDAARPVSVQQTLFDAVKGTPQARYVANPRNTGLHNYGAAVDLTIVDSQNQALDMGTPFDHLGREAHTDIEPQLLAEGTLTKKQIRNRELLRTVMRKEGFRVLKREWWHFNACALSEAKQKYRLLDF